MQNLEVGFFFIILIKYGLVKNLHKETLDISFFSLHL